MTFSVAKTYYHRVYCNGLQRLTFVTIKVYCNKMKAIETKNFVAINIFSCSAMRDRFCTERHLSKENRCNTRNLIDGK